MRGVVVGVGLAVLAGCSAAEPETPAPFVTPAPAEPPPAAPGTKAPQRAVVNNEPIGAADAGGWTAPVLPTSSAACGTGVSHAPGSTFVTASGRSYHVWAPSDHDSRTPLPVVLAYHGWAASGRAHQGWFQEEQYVEGKAIVVYPDADGTAWDVSGDKDVVFFDAMMEGLAATYCIDPSRVLAFGYSWGARFASHLGCRRAGYVKAIAMGAGSFGGDASACGRLPVFVTSRIADRTQTASDGRAAQAKWAELNGCTGGHGPPDDTFGCITHEGCAAPGHVTYCEDGWFDPSWPDAWNHTVRETYRARVWSWFAALPR